jgi:RNA recognition motif-containing protein
MSCKLFIGGLSWNTTDESLRSKFEEFGIVEDAVVLKFRETGRSRGFGFVTFQNTEEAEAAIEAMNEKDFEGRTIRVDKAGDRPAGDRPSGGNFRGGRGGRGGNSFGGGRSYGGDRPYGERSSYGNNDRHGGERSGGYRRRDDRGDEDRSEYRSRDY